MRLKGRTAAMLLGAASLAFLALTTACTSDAVGPAPAEAREAPGNPDVTFYVVAFHWGWAVFDEEGRELDGIRVAEGTTVELYAVNPHAAEAIGRLPAAIAAAINVIEWDGERVRSEIEVGRLPDPQVLIGMSLDDVLAAGHDEGDVHDDAAEVHDDDEGDAHDDDHAAAAANAVSDHDDAHDDGAEAEPDADHSMPAWQMPWQGEGELATHGFLIPWYGVARKLEPDAGEPVRVVFTADRPGTYEFQCVVYCGFGHRYQAREMLFVEAAQ